MTQLITPHGGYRKLKSFQAATLVYDLTVMFCAQFVKAYRMADQMIQAARSGRQNIAEGCQASGTSKKTEIKLVSVARASLEELLLDYEDYLRQHGFRVWDKNHPQALQIRELAYQEDRTVDTYKECIATEDSFANTMVCLIHQANYLLDRQLRALEQHFLEDGGFTERMYNARKGSSK